MMTKEAMKLALEALDIVNPKEFAQADPNGKIDKAITALREALAEQPAQCAPAEDGVCEALNCPNHKPAQRTWVGLTDEQMLAIVHYSQLDNARAIEAKIKEMNT